TKSTFTGTCWASGIVWMVLTAPLSRCEQVRVTAEDQDDHESHSEHLGHLLPLSNLGHRRTTCTDYCSASKATDNVTPTAEDHHDELLDDVVAPNVVLHVVEVCHDGHGDPGQSAGQGERECVDPVGRDAQSRRHRPVLYHRTRLQTERCAVEEQIDRQKTE